MEVLIGNTLGNVLYIWELSEELNHFQISHLGKGLQLGTAPVFPVDNLRFRDNSRTYECLVLTSELLTFFYSFSNLVIELAFVKKINK